MIKYQTKFNFDGKDWIVTALLEVQYVNYHGYVVTVLCFDETGKKFYIDLLANGTPIGYSKD